MPAIAPIKILKPKVNPRKIPVIEANKIEAIKKMTFHKFYF